MKNVKKNQSFCFVVLTLLDTMITNEVSRTWNSIHSFFQPEIQIALIDVLFDCGFQTSSRFLSFSVF
jgi:hypothetical protein